MDKEGVDTVIATGLLTDNEYLMNEQWRYVIEPKLPDIASIRALRAGLRLVGLDQIAYPPCVGFAVTAAGNWIGSAGRFDSDLRPERAGRNMYRCHVRHGDALFIAAE